jgi:hypothetical protein
VALLWKLKEELRFTDKGAAAFIKQFHSTLIYAKLEAGATLSDHEIDETVDKSGRQEEQLSLGDLVQWTSGGVDQFVTPRRVTAFSEDGSHIFVEGTDVGLPVAEIEKANPPPTPAPPTQPLSPREERSAMEQASFPLESGQVILQWPQKMSQTDFEDFKAWLEVLTKRLERVSAYKEEPGDIV